MLITQSEYLEVDGTPLSTPAWEVTDLSQMYETPENRGEDEAVPYHEGMQPRRRIIGTKHVILPIFIYGGEDPDGASYANARAGFQANTDLLKRLVLKPVQKGNGTRTLRHHLPDGSVRAGAGRVLGPFSPAPVGPSSARGTVDVVIPGGVLRDEVATEAVLALTGAATDLVVEHPGTADQFEVFLELAGTCTALRIENRTWDPTGDTFLEFNGAPAPGAVIDAGLWTAVRDGASVVGLINHGGHERWLPLEPGDNTLRFIPTGGTVSATVSHYAPYL
jgi:hypothetical protein